MELQRIKVQYIRYRIYRSAEEELSVIKAFEFEERIQREVFKILLDWSTRNEIDFNMKNENGRTAFIWACSCGYINVVQLLLDYFDSEHIDLNTTNNVGYIIGYVLDTNIIFLSCITFDLLFTSITFKFSVPNSNLKDPL